MKDRTPKADALRAMRERQSAGYRVKAPKVKKSDPPKKRRPK